jgi:hypothetical protein
MTDMSIKRNALRVAATAVASGILAGGALATAASASAAIYPGYSFQTLDNAHDLTFNQLLGINDEGVIAGYFGSGMAGHPNKGYVLPSPDGPGSYLNENFPGSVQTQVTGLNNRSVTVGFWSNTNMGSGDANFGWVNVNGHFREADYPTNDPASPVADQLLGVNDQDVAVGFYTDGQGYTHGYEYNILTNTYSLVTDPHDPQANLTAAAINDNGDVAGFYTTGDGTTDGFVMNHRQHWFIDLAVPGASSTTALGVNDSEEVVGTYTVGSGSTAVMHGFTWSPEGGFTTIDDPHGVGTTTINGVNDRGDLVGFYVDSNGNTDGFLATPQG